MGFCRRGPAISRFLSGVIVFHTCSSARSLSLPQTSTPWFFDLVWFFFFILGNTFSWEKNTSFYFGFDSYLLRRLEENVTPSSGDPDTNNSLSETKLFSVNQCTFPFSGCRLALSLFREFCRSFSLRRVTQRIRKDSRSVLVYSTIILCHFQ